MATVEHVQLFKVKYLCQKKWHTELSQYNLTHIPTGFFRVICRSYALMSACLASCHGFVVFPQGCRGTVILALLSRGCGDTVAHSKVLIKGWGGGSWNWTKGAPFPE